LNISKNLKVSGKVPSTPKVYYLLGWQQPNSKIAVLCKSYSGPALCKTWKEAVKLRSNLLNDPRGSKNKFAKYIIKELRIYMINKGEPLFWRPGDLWVYIDRRVLKEVET